MREIVFDTETTGFDPKGGHKMVEIGCIELFNRLPTGAVFHAYFDPERDMPAEAEAVHGLSIAFLTGKPRFAERAADLIDFLGDAPLIAHNAAFDFGFLNAELAVAGLDAVSLDRMIDTIAIARRKHPGAKLSLDALCSRYGIDRSHRTKHGALLDAELLAQLYVELLGGRQIGLELAADPAPVAFAPQGQIGQAGAAMLARVVRPPRPHHASDAELARHQDFIAGFEDPLWTRP
ncbi:DNA polymerase III subunit epsilon [Novosphingobium sp.]|uniref:DNA polymerase III subunit epsilon n=1 Tax=Novosphingobium sp. TaxID=1874826 RepID=UPI0033405E6E